MPLACIRSHSWLYTYTLIGSYNHNPDDTYVIRIVTVPVCLYPCQVDVVLSTYNANGLTDNDITMATFMDEISGKKAS